MIYLYAFTDHPKSALPAVPGLEDANGNPMALSEVVYQDSAAVISTLNSLKVPALETNIWRHEAVLEALMTCRTILPVRFGTLLKDEAALQAALVTYYQGLILGLQRVSGRVEIGVQVLWDETPPAPAAATPAVGEIEFRIDASAAAPVTPISGRQYMLARLEEEHRTVAYRQRAESLAAKIQHVLAPLAAENQQQILLTPRLLLKASYLVPRQQVEAFRSAVENLGQAYPELNFLCVGPWPAYSFVSDITAKTL